LIRATSATLSRLRVSSSPASSLVFAAAVQRLDTTWERTMIDTSDTQDRVRQCIADLFLPEGEADALRNDTDLLGVLDSLQVLRLVIELESQFAIKVRDGELTVDNFGTVADIATFIHQKREMAARPDEAFAQAR
jgi:acyl carrier protein